MTGRLIWVWDAVAPTQGRRAIDTELLDVLVAGADPADDLVLDAAGEAAYQRTVDRFNAMWADSSPLSRWTY